MVRLFEPGKLSIFFNGVFSLGDWGVAMHFPSIPSPEPRIETTTIPGGVGDVYFDQGGYKDIIIPIEFEAVDRVNLMAKFRQIKKDCYNIKDNRLILSYDEDYCYLVQYVEPMTLTQEYLISGKLIINFVCKPYMYAVDGLVTLKNLEQTTLMGEHGGYPLIKLISPERLTTTETTMNLTVNGVVRTYTFKNYIIIDSEQEIIYGANGIIDEAYFVTGVGYPELKEGTNTISVDRGTFEITPRFRCL